MFPVVLCNSRFLKPDDFPGLWRLAWAVTEEGQGGSENAVWAF